ncbi:MAG: hypothetical protein EAZ87_17510 [Nostocales cyanobacterium]|nr:MAG: hypothetical protein EAZ87_17510 [Nostocales cyanobacterium]
MNKLQTSLPFLVILSGIVFSLYLLLLVPDHLYFSGDGGLKALLAEQIANGQLRFDLNLQVPEWVQNIWNSGLYPFEPPFSYKIKGLYYITFPFTFPLATAPFYAIFGYRGFYIIPLVSTWIIWFNFHRLCLALKLNYIISAVGLIILIFSSPLTMYSAMYWEHTLAVCLAFSGIVTLVYHQENYLNKNSLIFAGILIALSAWFRPEFLALIAILTTLVTASYIIKFDFINLVKYNKTVFLISLILTILGFFACNKLIYDHPLGAHAFQVVENFSLQERLLKSYKFFTILKNELLKYFPVLYFGLAIVITAIFRANLRLKSEIIQIVLVSGLYMLFVPILIPSDGGKQWGPRFLLFLIPLITIIAISNLDKIWKIKRFGIRYIVIGVLTVFLPLGFNINTIQGLETVYQKDKPENLEVLNFLNQETTKFIAVANQYVGQSFPSTFTDKIYFLTKEAKDVSQLGLALHQQGEQKFIYICPVYDACFSRNPLPDRIEVTDNQEKLIIQLQPIQENRRFKIQSATIIQDK